MGGQRSRKARGDALRAPGRPGADNVSGIIEMSVDIVISIPHVRKMRDDRYQGTSLPRPVRKLCLMRHLQNCERGRNF